MNHTPTPWHMSGSSTNSDAPINICGHVSTMMLPQDYRHVATVNREEELGWGEGLDNAAFILRACNAHEALVAVTEKFLDLCPRMNEDDPVAPALFDACEQALAALKLAKGE